VVVEMANGAHQALLDEFGAGSSCSPRRTPWSRRGATLPRRTPTGLGAGVQPWQLAPVGEGSGEGEPGAGLGDRQSQGL
jgi:hypothetical protein